MFKAFKIMAFCLACLSFVACGGGGGGGGTGGGAPAAAPEIKTGIFVDGPVEGLTYESGSQRGITDARGAFKYEDGNTVRFSVGGIVLGQATARSTMSPISLANAGSNAETPEVVARVRFLMAISVIDGAGNMKISQTARDKTLSQTVDFAVIDDVALSALVTALDSTKTMSTIEEAITHLTASVGDTTPPGPPALRTPADFDVAYNSVRLQWSASTDRVGVVGYDVYRGTIKVGQTTGDITTFTDTANVNSNTTYTYQIMALDAAGNISSGSNVITVTTGIPVSVTVSGNVTP